MGKSADQIRAETEAMSREEEGFMTAGDRSAELAERMA
jgi:hypothetical protein